MFFFIELIIWYCFPGPSKPTAKYKTPLKNIITVEVAAALDRCKVSDHSGMNDSFVKSNITENDRVALLDFFERQLNQQHHRDDYREVIQLTQ